MASIDEKLVQEANIGLQHANGACMLDEEVQRLKSEDAVNDTKPRLEKQKLERIEVTFPI